MKNWITVILLMAVAWPRWATAQAEVVSFTPLGEVRRIQQAAVRYGADMVRLGEGDAAAPIGITCPQGNAATPKGRWLDTRRYVYEWPNDLPIGTRCVVTQRAGLKTLEGRDVKAAGPWEFTTGGPKLATTIPYNGDNNIKEHDVFLLRPDAQPDVASVDQHLMCQTEGESSVRPQRLAREEGIRAMRARQPYFEERDWDTQFWMAYRCPRPFANSTKVRLIWSAHIAAVSGVASRTDQIINYAVRPLFTLNVTCGMLDGVAGCDPRNGLNLNFTAPVAPNEFKKIVITADGGKAIALRPVGNNSAQNYIASEPMEVLDEGGRATVSLTEALRDTDGRVLTNARDFPKPIVVAKLPPYIGFVHENNIVLARTSEMGKPAQLAVAARYVEPRITVKAVHISGAQGEAGEKAALTLMRSVNNWHNNDGASARYPMLEQYGAKVARPQDMTLETNGGAMAFYGLPLTKPGLWLVELDSPAFRAARKADQRPAYQRARLVQVTNLNIHMRASPHGNSLAWITAFDDGKPVADADMALYDCNDKLVWGGKSAGDGTAKIPLMRGCSGSYSDSHSLVVRKGDDLSLLRFNTNSDPRQPAGPVLGHTVLDRALFKPGETLHLENHVRELTASGFKHLPPTQGTIEILFNNNELAHKGEVRWNEHGAANASWRIPANAKLGRYVARVRDSTTGATYDAPFQVEEFRMPVFDAKLTGAPVWRGTTQQDLPINVSLNYLSGGAAAGEPVSLRGRWTMGAAPPMPGFEFTNRRIAPFQPQNEAPRPLTLDDKGEARTTLNPPLSSHAISLLAEMQFSDPNGEVQTVAQRFSAWPYPNKVGVRATMLADAPRGTATRTVELSGVVLDAADKPLAGKNMRFAIVRARNTNVGTLESMGEEKPACEATTNVRGEARCSWTPGSPGETPELAYNEVWLITARADGEKHEANATLAGWQLRWAPSNAVLEIEGYNAQDNNAALAPADTAQLRVRAPFVPAILLLTLEREGVLEHSVHAIASNDVTLPVAMKGHFAPNVQLAAAFVRPLNVTAQAEAEPSSRLQVHAQHAINVRVRPTAYALRVELKPQRDEARVRERVPVAVSVRTLAGASAPNARVTVIAVDDALLALRPNNTWNLFAAMTRNRSVPVQYQTLAAQLAREIAIGARRDFRPQDEQVFRSDATTSTIGIRGFDAARVMAGAPPPAPAAKPMMRMADPGAGGASGSDPAVRSEFSSLALWQTDAVTDANGNATIDVPLNDSLTRWRIVAVATHEADKFGTGEATLRTVQPLQVVSGLPISVRSGDALIQKVTLRNTTKQSINVEFSARAQLTASGGAAEKSEADAARGLMISRTITLKPEQNQEVMWPVSVPDNVERMKWRISAKSADMTDAIEIEQVVTPAVPVTVRQAMLLQVEKSVNVPVAQPTGARAGAGGVSVDWKASLGDAALLEVRKWMKSYPFICLEQKTSKLAALGDREGWDLLMRELPKYLDGNGLARYFPTTQLPGSETLTAYVLDTAAALKWTIPAPEKTRMLSALRAQLAGRTQALDWAPQDVSVARALSLQATLIEQAPGQKLERVVTPVDMASLPTTALVDWVRYLLASPKDAKRADALKEAANTLRSRYDVQGTRLNWRNEARENWWWFMWNGNVAAARTAWVVNRWSAEDASWKDELPLLVTGLVGRQQQGHWGTTTANVWGSIALAEFARVREAEPVSGASTMRLAGQSATVTWPTTATTALAWPKEPQSTLTLSHSGTGAPWATVAVRAAVKLDKPVAQGLTISRAVTPVEQKVTGQWSVGDTARVTLTMSSSAALTWVVVRDPVPSGATILGRGLARESTLAQQGQQRSGAWPVFEERAAESYRGYYRYVPQGTWNVEYAVRINNAGTFEFPPARVEAMYAPEIFGETPIEALVVKP